LIGVLSPVLCFLITILLQKTVDYQLGYELLIVNALMVVVGLLAVKGNKK
jgi:Tfp pilus assembly protein PilX